MWDQPCFDGNWLTIVEKIKQLEKDGTAVYVEGGMSWGLLSKSV